METINNRGIDPGDSIPIPERMGAIEKTGILASGGGGVNQSGEGSIVDTQESWLGSSSLQGEIANKPRLKGGGVIHVMFSCYARDRCPSIVLLVGVRIECMEKVEALCGGGTTEMDSQGGWLFQRCRGRKLLIHVTVKPPNVGRCCSC